LQAPTSTDGGGVVSLRDLINFIAHVADCYASTTSGFKDDLIELLRLHHAELEPELREKIVGSLCLLRKKNLLSSQE
jgi:protein SDA1